MMWWRRVNHVCLVTDYSVFSWKLPNQPNTSADVPFTCENIKVLLFFNAWIYWPYTRSITTIFFCSRIFFCLNSSFCYMTYSIDKTPVKVWLSCRKSPSTFFLFNLQYLYAQEEKRYQDFVVFFVKNLNIKHQPVWFILKITLRPHLLGF